MEIEKKGSMEKNESQDWPMMDITSFLLPSHLKRQQLSSTPYQIKEW